VRLFLSSYRAGKHDDKLRDFLGSIDKVAVITNAKDYKTTQDRRDKVEENFDYYRSIGLKPTEIDLRPLFHKPGAEKMLAGHNFIWLAGGNVFLLRRALKYTGLDKYLYDNVRKNEIIIGGESAGAVIMGPTLKFSELETDEDSPDHIPEGYDKEVIWEGLGFMAYVPVPHHKALDYGDGIDKYIEQLDKYSIPHKEMTDDQVIIINGGKEEFLA
jgi:dipeptidase E